jgi:hypothetical protein
MVAYLAQAIRFMMHQPVIMGAWIAFTTMLYLLHHRVHRFRRHGTFRLFATCLIMGVAIPGTTTVMSWAFDRFIEPHAPQLAYSLTRQMVYVGMAPVLVVLVFALTVTLIQRFIGADAETAMSLSWPITAITYVVPLAICFFLSIFHIPWLTGEQTYP